jgi:hypothetical protein
MSTLSVGIVQSQTVNPPVVRNSIGTEIGTFCRAWCKFDGSVANPTSTMVGFNVSSITDNGVGRYVVNFTTSMVDTNYAALVDIGTSGNLGLGVVIGNSAVPPNKTVSSCTIRAMNFDADGIDPSIVSFAVFR